MAQNDNPAIANKAIDEIGRHCLNCDALLQNSYCAQCGQSANIHRSLGALWHDFLHGVLHFDGKFWYTLPMLLFKPGQLTRDYIAGKRARYISPMALFLFSIFLMFVVFSFISAPSIPESDNQYAQQGNILTNLQQVSESELTKQIEQVKADIAAGKVADEDGNDNQQKLASLESALAIARDIGDEDQIVQIDGLEKVLGGNKQLAQRLQKDIHDINENSEFLLYKMKSNGYKFAWLLIPLSIPFVWFAMIGLRGYHLYDHAIFSIYSISFMSLLFIFMAVVNAAGISGGWTIPALVFIPLLHLYKQVKYAYRLSRLQTIARLSLLCLGIFFVIIFFLFLLLALGILG